MKYYSRKKGETKTDPDKLFTYAGVNYGQAGSATYNVTKAEDRYGIYSTWFVESEGDMIFVLKARWDMQRAVIFDRNVTADKIDSVTAFPDPEISSIYTANKSGDWKYEVETDTRKAIPYTTPLRQKYNFRGWSTNSGAAVGSSQILSDTSAGYVGVYGTSCITPTYSETSGGYFYARLYAVWEPLYTHTFIYQLNRPGFKQDDYPQGSYLGKDDALLTDGMWNADSGTWTEILDEDDINDSSRYFTSGTSSYLRVKNGLLKSDYYIFRGWDVKTFTRKLNGTETDEEKILFLPDTATFPGRYELNHTNSLNVTDADSVVGLFDGWFKGKNGAAGEPTVTYLKARCEPRRVFVLKYNTNLGGEGKPSADDYVRDYALNGEDELSTLPQNEDGEWEDIIEEDVASGFGRGYYYPLKHNKLQAKGYQFVGWDMYYYRKNDSPEGKRRSGPYKYRINNNGEFSSNYGIYGTWFDRGDCVDMAFELYAAWEPQYEVFYHEGVDEEHLSEVSEMPDPKYSGIVKYKNWRGTGTKVFRAHAPKRSGYYFVGWSTRSDLDVDTNRDDINLVLHRNHLGPSVPKSACSNPQHNDMDEGYLRTDLYAVWSAKPVYSIYFDENADGETYPSIEYLGAVAGKKEPDPWTVRLTEEEARDIPGMYYEFDKDVVLAAKGYQFTGWHLTYTRGYGTTANHDYRLSGGKYGIYTEWIKASECPDLEFFVSANWDPQYKVAFHDGDSLLCESAVVQKKAFVSGRKVFKPSVVPTKPGKYLVGWSTDPDYDFAQYGTTGEHFVKGVKNVTLYKNAFTAADYNDTDQGFLRADLYAVWSDEPAYYILYDANEEGLDNDPFVGEYTGVKDEAMVWEEVITQTQLNSDIAENKGYPLHRGYLTAKGYIFTGWKLTYIRESTEMPSGGFYSVDKPDSSFKIYPTWFNDVVDNEFLLSAVWKPQFAVKFLPNGNNVTNMPAFEYTPLKEERRFTGSPATAVFQAAVPKREGWYFAGWSTDPDYKVETQGLNGLLHRNHIGPAVPQYSCINALYSEEAPYDYKGFMCAYVYAIWSPHPVYHIVYDPGKEQLENGAEYLSDAMPEAPLVDGQWVFDYTKTEMESLISSAAGDNNAAGYYPLLKGDLTATGNIYTGWKLHWNNQYGEDKTDDYPVSSYGHDPFRIHSNRLINDTSDYQFLLTANWETRYSVQFHGNAGSDTVTNMPAKNPSELYKDSDFNRDGEKVKIFSDKGEMSSKPPMRDGYVFCGWSTDPNAAPSSTLLQRTASGVYVNLSDCTNPVENSFRAELYAVWTSGHSVSYELTGTVPEGASDIPEKKDYPTGTENIPIEPAMTAPGYTFSDWSVKTAPDELAVDTVNHTFTMPNGNVVFTGSFSPVDYTVNYYRNKNADDNEILRSATFHITDVTDGNIPLNTAAPTAFDTKHEFKYWSGVRDGSEWQSITFNENARYLPTGKRFLKRFTT